MDQTIELLARTIQYRVARVVVLLFVHCLPVLRLAFAVERALLGNESITEPTLKDVVVRVLDFCESVL